MTVATKPPPDQLTPLDEKLTVQQPALVRTNLSPARRGQREVSEVRATAPQIWQALSADHRWRYERTETPTTPWLATYLPTGQDVLFTTLADARLWTARQDGQVALSRLKAMADEVIARGGASTAITMVPGPGGRLIRGSENPRLVAERLGLALRCAQVLDGRLVTAAVTARCLGSSERVCGGYLTELPAGWVHVDVCSECVDEPGVAGRRACRALHLHRSCGGPDPVLCEHQRCARPALLDPAACPRGRFGCDGCCTLEEGS